MGPRSRERGNSFEGRTISNTVAELQWGRAHVSAETAGLVILAGCAVIASMGPRSRERGNASAYLTGQHPAAGFNGAALT